MSSLQPPKSRVNKYDGYHPAIHKDSHWWYGMERVARRLIDCAADRNALTSRMNAIEFHAFPSINALRRWLAESEDRSYVIMSRPPEGWTAHRIYKIVTVHERL